MSNLDSIFKSRDSTLPTKACLVKAMVFPVVMYGCESWTVKKAEHRRIDAFELLGHLGLVSVGSRLSLGNQGRRTSWRSGMGLRFELGSRTGKPRNRLFPHSFIPLLCHRDVLHILSFQS